MWGATCSKQTVVTTKEISIHAPMWGATFPITQDSHYILISIHAPMWGATGRLFKRVGRIDISIHAPMWGATNRTQIANQVFLFQSTHPCGVRRALVPSLYPNPSYFNPRTHVGCDLFLCLKWKVIIYFNPRTHVGCDRL